MRSRNAKKAAKHRSDCVSERTRVRNDIEQLEKGAGLRLDFRQSQTGLLDREIRDMYFAVESAEQRKKLIALHRTWVKLGNEVMTAEIEEGNARLEDARRDGAILEEIGPPLLGLLAVWIGTKADGVIGAVGGAVVGIFVGLSYMRYRAAERQFVIEYEQSYLNDAINTKKEDYPYPHRFTDAEAQTGEKDKDFDAKSTSSAYD